MRINRKIKTDIENLRILHSLNRINNSPRNMHHPKINFYDQSPSNNKKFNINTRTIFLQKTTNNSYFPVKVEILKTRQNGISYSPASRSINSRSHSRFYNNSFAYNSIEVDNNNNFNLENNIPNNRNSFDINTSQEIMKNKNINQIKKLKNSLGNPKEARNLMINNMGRNNRFTSASPSENSMRDTMKEKNNICLPYNDINFGENYFDERHQIRYLLSKDNLNKFKKYKNNNLKINYPNQNNVRGNYHNLFPRNNEDYNINNINIENSPENKSDIIDNNYQSSSGTKTTNKAQMKRKTPNITPILSEDSPYFMPTNQIIQEEVQLNESDNNIINSNNIFLNNNANSSYKIVEIKLDDLIFIEGRLNDIILSLNNDKNVLDIGSINESVEFFVFYFHSSLKNKMNLFFTEKNRLIIKSAFNLNLFVIMITYHLSLNPSMLVKIILLLKQIYNLLKMNLFLLIRKIELYYGDDFCRKNEIYFKTCDYYLIENGLENLYENEIINIIRKNCITISNDINDILNYYQTINNKYYNDFYDIFFNISRIDEQDINNYFYNYLFNSTKENIINQQRISKNKNNNNMNNINIINNLIENQNQSFQKVSEEENQFMDKIIESYNRNKEMSPFLKNKCRKKYTLVLDLEDTLISVKLINDGKMVISTRPGLIPFLTGVKPYYEIISFSKLSKNYSKIIVDQIEENRKLFDYNLYREHCILVGKKFEKDISKIGRSMKKIIMVDDMIENLNLQKENGILILPYEGENNKEDRVLYELKTLLILFYNLGYEDLRNALKSYKNEIYEKITLGLTES